MTTPEPSTAPGRQGLVLTALILVAAVANLNLAVANVALPDIGKAFDASQTELNLVAVSYSLGLAASVLYLGALGDRYGRKMMLLLGLVLSVPACLLAAWAPSVEVLIGARLLGGLSAGMAYPTTLALITALWSGPARTKSIALWSALGGGISALGPLTAGALLEEFWWGSVFLVTLPLAVVAFVLALVARPEPRQRDDRSRRQPRRDPVDRPRRQRRAGHQLRTGPERGCPGRRAGGDRRRRRHRLRRAPAPSRVAALRPAHRRPAHVLGRRMRRADRVRHPDGGDVHRPAVPAERARLLDGRGRGSDPPGGGDDGADRTALGQARRSARLTIDPARRLCLLPARLRDHAPALGRGEPPTGWSGSATR